MDNTKEFTGVVRIYKNGTVQVVDQLFFNQIELLEQMQQKYPEIFDGFINGISDSAHYCLPCTITINIDEIYGVAN